jgi:Glyceraldehyde-3-phosphate dehydrogenase/erythrose-4-phosphate dehydrogenase
MSKVKVSVAGYGTIGQRLADGVFLQKDMELVGVADVAPTLSIRALREKGMPYKLFLASEEKRAEFEALGIPVSGTMEDMVKASDVVLDSSPGGIGAKNKELYERLGKRRFSGGEKTALPTSSFTVTPTTKRASGKDTSSSLPATRPASSGASTASTGPMA